MRLYPMVETITSLQDISANGNAGQFITLPFLVLAVERAFNKDVLVVTDLTRISNNNVLYQYKNSVFRLGNLLNVYESMILTLWYLNSRPTIADFYRDYERKFHKKFDPLELRNDYQGETDIYASQLTSRQNDFAKNYLFANCTFRLKKGKFGYEGVITSVEIVNLSNLSNHFQEFSGLFERILNQCEKPWIFNPKNILRQYILSFVKFKDEEQSKKEKSNKRRELTQDYDAFEVKKPKTELSPKWPSNLLNPDLVEKKPKSIPIFHPTSNILYQGNFAGPQEFQESQSMDIFEQSQAFINLSSKQPSSSEESVSSLIRMDLQAPANHITVSGHIVFLNFQDFVRRTPPFEEYLVKSNYRFHSKKIGAYKSFKRSNLVSKDFNNNFLFSNVQIVINDTGLTGDEYLAIDIFNDHEPDWQRKYIKFLGDFESLEEVLENYDEIAAKFQQLEQGGTSNKKVLLKVSRKIVENKLGVKMARWFIDDDLLTLNDLIEF